MSDPMMNLVGSGDVFALKAPFAQRVGGQLRMAQRLPPGRLI